MTKLSVIVVTYNEVEYIDETIDSIFKQCFNYNYEIIIGDDGSNDGTIQKIILYQKKYPKIIKYFVMERDNTPVVSSIGVSNVIRRALMLAKGEYINLIAGDDFYCNTDKFSSQIDILDKPENSDCIGCAGHWYKWYSNEDKAIEGNIFGSFDSKYDSKLFWENRQWIHVSAFTFRNVFKNNSTPVKNLLIDDTGFTTLLGQYGKFYIHPQPVFCYRQRSKSIMATHNKIQLFWIEMCLIEDVKNNIPTLRQHCLPRSYYYIAYFCFFEKNIYDLEYKKFFELYMSICKNDFDRMFGIDIKKHC